MAEPRRATRNEWFADGLRFQCTQCGNCCSGPPGAVWFNEAEGRAMARARGASEKEFYARYARQVDGKWSLIEHEVDGKLDCVFLDRESVPGRALCGVYQARPAQCRTWPFWPENLKTRRAWEQAKRQTPCPGMDTGELYPVERVRVLRDGRTDQLT